MRALLACLLFAIGCTNAGTFVVVNVLKGATTPDTYKLDFDLLLGGKQASASFTNHGAVIAWPAAASLHIRTGSGRLMVTVVARDANGTEVDRGSGEVDVVAGTTQSLDVTLGTTMMLDGGMSDSDMSDMAQNSDGGVDLAAPTAPAIFAIHASPTDATHTIIEGTFGANPALLLPNGTAATVSALGPHRLDVTLPANASAGNIHVVTDGFSSNDVPFRRTSYAMGMQTFRPQYPQTMVGHTMTQLVTARADACAITTATNVYVIGGSDASSTLFDSVEKATLNADGTVGAFTNAGITLVHPRSELACFRVADYVYVVGGTTNTGPGPNTERATIDANGELGAFTDVGSAPPVLNGTTFAIIGNYLYAFGGQNPAAVTSVARAPFATDGTLGGFADAGIALSHPRAYATAEVVSGYVHLIGGYDGVVLTSIDSAVIDGSGNVASFAHSGDLDTATLHHTSAVIGGKVYVFGGGETASASIQTASINTNGTLGTFSTDVITLGTARTRHAMFVNDNMLYAIGGTQSGPPLATAVAANMIGSGQIASPGQLGANLTVARTRHQSVVLGRYVYVVGGTTNGTTSLNSIERAPIAADGTVGTFVASGSMSGARDGHGLAVIGNHLYAFGGNGSIGQSYEYADITGGDIGTFGHFTYGMTDTRVNARFVVDGTNLFVLGGSGGGTQEAEEAPINANFTLGTFTAMPGPYGLAGLASFSSGGFGPYLMRIGGINQSSSTSLTTAAYSYSPAGMPLSSFATVGTLNVARGAHTSFSVGSLLYIAGGQSDASTRLATVEQTTVLTGGTIGGTFSSSSYSLLSARARPTSIVVGDYVYFFGGEGTNGNVLATGERGLLQ